jgi:hypothetical protein
MRFENILNTACMIYGNRVCRARSFVLRERWVYYQGAMGSAGLEEFVYYMGKAWPKQDIIRRNAQICSKVLQVDSVIRVRVWPQESNVPQYALRIGNRKVIEV